LLCRIIGSVSRLCKERISFPPPPGVDPSRSDDRRIACMHACGWTGLRDSVTSEGDPGELASDSELSRAFLYVPDFDQLLTGNEHESFGTNWRSSWRISLGGQDRSGQIRSDAIPCSVLAYEALAHQDACLVSCSSSSSSSSSRI